MSNGRKTNRHLGNRSFPRGQRDAPRPWESVALFVATLIVIIPVTVSSVPYLFRPDYPNQQWPTGTIAGNASGPRAAIVDQLSLTQPNKVFSDRATELLERAGYAVDYYPGEQVTVDFYRNLAIWGHQLIVLRAHSAQGGTDELPADWVTLFTSESYRKTWHAEEQAAQRLSTVDFHRGGPQYFGIMPSFIESSMRGSLRDATIIVMGCDGLGSASIGDAFVERGAKAVVGWDGSVSSAHTDAATERFLHHLLIDGHTTHDAVAETMAEIGLDPQYDSRLVAYPFPERSADSLGPQPVKNSDASRLSPPLCRSPQEFSEISARGVVQAQFTGIRAGSGMPPSGHSLV